MNLFNENSLAELLEKCYRNERYQSAIMFNHSQEAHRFIEEMAELHNNEGIDGVSRILMRNQRPRIEFENGSYIEAITTTISSFRGLRYNEGLLDPEVMDGEAMMHFEAQIRDYNETRTLDREYRGIWGKKYKSENEDLKVDKKSAKVLDGFLDSFKVT